MFPHVWPGGSHVLADVLKGPLWGVSAGLGAGGAAWGVTAGGRERSAGASVLLCISALLSSVFPSHSYCLFLLGFLLAQFFSNVFI